MDSSIAGLTAQPKPLSVGDRTFLLHQLDFADLGKIQAWCDAQRPDPFAIVAAQLNTGRFNRQQEQFLLAEAIRQAGEPTPRLGSAECSELLSSFEGFALVFQISVGKGDAGFTLDRAREVARGFNEAHILAVTSALSLDLIRPEGDDPKASTSGASTTPP